MDEILGEDLFRLHLEAYLTLDPSKTVRSDTRMSASHKPAAPQFACPTCSAKHYIEDHGEHRQLFVDDLPPSDRPWIFIKFRGALLAVNEDWAPCVLEDGKMTMLEDHMPSDLSMADLDHWTPDDIEAEPVQ